MIDFLTGILSSLFLWASGHPWWFIYLWLAVHVIGDQIIEATVRLMKRRGLWPRIVFGKE